MPTLYTVIRRPLITEKGLGVKETEGTLVFDVAPDASKTEVKQAVEALFKVVWQELCDLFTLHGHLLEVLPTRRLFSASFPWRSGEKPCADPGGRDGCEFLRC